MDSPSTSIYPEIHAVVREASAVSARTAEQLRRRLRLWRSYHRTFFDEEGTLRPEARDVLADLVAQSQMGAATTYLTDAELREVEGMRKLVMHLFGRFRLSADEVRRMERQIHEAMENDDG